MAQISVKITDLPKTVSQARLKELLSQEGRVISLKPVSGGYAAVLDSPSISIKLEKSSVGAMGLASVLYADSSGIAELQAAVISLR